MSSTTEWTDGDPSLSLPERIRLRHDLLTEGQRKVARFCLMSPAEAGELTAMRIADRVQVSESTVVRFAGRLGYRGFPDLQAALRASLAGRRSGGKPSRTETLPDDLSRIASQLDKDVEALRESVAAIDLDVLKESADILAAATRIFVVGFRTSFSVAHLASFHIKNVHPSVHLLDDMGGGFEDDIEMVTKGDVLLAVTFPRYDRRTLSAISLARERGLRIIAITDSVLSPAGDLPQAIFVGHHSLSFFNSTAAATAVVNALVVGMVEKRGTEDSTFEHRLVEHFHAKSGER